MSRILRSNQPDQIAQERQGDNLVIRNSRTGQAVTLSRADATPARIREAKKLLQPKVDDPYEGVSAKEAVSRMYGTDTKSPDDPEPILPAVAKGPLAEKRRREHAEWQARREAERQRDRELRDRKALAAEIADNLKAASAQPETPAAALDDLSWEQFVARAEQSAAARAAEGGGIEQPQT